jgi:hypothetical protein
MSSIPSIAQVAHCKSKSTNHGEFSRLIAEARKSKVKNGTSSMPVEQHPQDDLTIVADSEEDEKSPS